MTTQDTCSKCGAKTEHVTSREHYCLTCKRWLFFSLGEDK
jgi:transposase